ncbi:c-type cytochrome biogenesis protein CcsB [Dehalobacter sp. MCB1]|uniref:c-type cytochrome biogenesis protein CcsB n=1 Tax=unclassified Dehalobacter TaxID=2635733 RepID=UPI000E6BDB4A|nr:MULTISPECIES: c-type cytochrome biogenesis protein CcsB [unclassified Dehalobacter]RJE47271.1 c-type cytochrome biogenesis protein CcsB [Dehalobacter sp. MCB1]TCX54875.1 c-type cytochrome biogenesis protein CcsB [Dehalobacter sp. 12DCB1]
MDYLERPLLIINILCYGVAVLLYIKHISIKSMDGLLKTKIGMAAKNMTIGGLIINSVVLIIRYIWTGYPPLSNMYEFFLLFNWGTVVVYLLMESRYNFKQAGPIVLIMITSIQVLLVFFMDNSVRPLMPALRSSWLYFHVLTAIIAYGSFAVSFALGIIYLWMDRLKLSKRIPISSDTSYNPNTIEEISYKMILVGISFLTLVIASGAVWAEQAWGSYWSWDPKETWALITWLIYASYLHIRMRGKWKGKFTIILTLIGFIVVLFTFAGVNILLPSLHSYV